MKIKIEYSTATAEELKELDSLDNNLLPTEQPIHGKFEVGLVTITKQGKLSKSLGICLIVGDKVAGGLTFSSLSRTDGKVDATDGTYVPIKGSVRDYYNNNRIGKTRLEVLSMVANELTKRGLVIHNDPYRRINSSTKNEFILNVQQLYFTDDDDFVVTQQL